MTIVFGHFILVVLISASMIPLWSLFGLSEPERPKRDFRETKDRPKRDFREIKDKSKTKTWENNLDLLFHHPRQFCAFRPVVKTPFNIYRYFISVKMTRGNFCMGTFNISHFHHQGLIIFPIKIGSNFIGR